MDGLQTNFLHVINAIEGWIILLSGLDQVHVLNGKTTEPNERPLNQAYGVYFIAYDEPAARPTVKREINLAGDLEKWSFIPKKLGVDLHFYSPDLRPIDQSAAPNDAGQIARQFCSLVRTDKAKSVLSRIDPAQYLDGGLSLLSLSGPRNQDTRTGENSAWVRHQYIALTLSYTETALETVKTINQVNIIGTSPFGDSNINIF